MCLVAFLSLSLSGCGWFNNGRPIPMEKDKLYEPVKISCDEKARIMATKDEKGLVIYSLDLCAKDTCREDATIVAFTAGGECKFLPKDCAAQQRCPGTTSPPTPPQAPQS